MTPKLLLVQSITLLYRESQLPGSHENSSELVRKVLELVKLPEVQLGIDHERDIILGMKTTALEMCNASVDHEWDIVEILQRLKVITGDDVELFTSFEQSISLHMDTPQLKRHCLSLKKSITSYFEGQQIGQIIQKAAQTYKFEPQKIKSMRKFVAETVSLLEPFMVDSGERDPAVVSEVHMLKATSAAAIYGSVKDQVSGVSVLRCGYQGINRMLDGGFRRGEEWVIGALQHNYKTGFSLTLFKQIALYNTPVMTDITKKPLLLRISFEDTLELNFQFLYSSLKENETGQVPDLNGVSPDEMSAYVYEQLSRSGYETYFMHVNASMWTYMDIQNKILELEAEGYEIHLCMVDYLLKVPTTGCDQGTAGVDIRNMYERLRAFFNSSGRSVCFITPHQLSTDAKMMKRSGSLELVKSMVGGGYYAGSKQIDQVVDGELFIHIESVNNESFLTVQRGKHRKIKQTPIEYLYAVLPFQKNGSILDDIFKSDSTRRKVGGGPLGSGEENPFWENADMMI